MTLWHRILRASHTRVDACSLIKHAAVYYQTTPLRLLNRKKKTHIFKELYGYTKTLLPLRIHPADAATKPWEFFYWGVLWVPLGGGDSEMWIRHTEDPSQGQGEHHSLAIIRSYLKLGGWR